VLVLRGLFLLSITRTFASGKNEKLAMQHLKDLGFASGKVKHSVFPTTLLSVRVCLHGCRIIQIWISMKLDMLPCW